MQILDLTPGSSGVPRNGKDQPMIVPKKGGRPEAYTRTTTFIDCIEDKSSIAKWGNRMVLLGVHKDPSILESVAEIDPTDTRALMALVERALKAAGAHDKADKGTELHAYSELVDQGIPLPESVSVTDRLDMAAYLLAVADAGITFSHIEQFIAIEEFGVGGTFDRRCHYAGPGPDGGPIDDNFIYDLKTGTVEYGALKMASQLAAYSRGELYDFKVFPAPPYARHVAKKDDPEGFQRWKEWDAWCKTEFTEGQAAAAYSPMPPVNQEWGIILNLPSGSSEVELYWADLTIGWEACEQAVIIRHMRSLAAKALKPFTV